MDSTRTSEVSRGVVLPLVILVVILALGIVVKDQAPVCIALMSVVPMVAAAFSGVRLTVIVAVAAAVAGVVLMVVSGTEPKDALIPLAGLVLSCILAVVVSRVDKVVIQHVEAPVQRRKTAQFQLQTQADLDSMTGLLNRRGAIRAVGPRNTEGARVVAFVDLDLFKDINDRFGGEVGDEFLQAVAGRLRHRLPAHDTVARWDGDEFLLVIAADAGSARPALERLVAGINGTTIRTTAGPIPAAVSVGAAMWTPGQDLEDAISRSGKALYAAKAGGRGRIVVDGESA